MLRAISGAGLMILAAHALLAQPAFDVASVKPNRSGSGNSTHHDRHGTLTATNVTLQYCIKLAYGVKDYQIVGPAWLSSERYDIQAKTSNSDPAQYRAMIQTLLADRFKLQVRRGTKDLPVYALVVGRRGPKLHETEAGAEHDNAGRDRLIGQKMSMAHLADRLSQLVGRPVLDMTGLDGVFDLELRWTPDDERRREGDTSDGPSSIFTAIQEQLGLKLEARKAPLEIIVVEHAEKVPSEN